MSSALRVRKKRRPLAEGGEEGEGVPPTAPRKELLGGLAHALWTRVTDKRAELAFAGAFGAEDKEWRSKSWS